MSSSTVSAERDLSEYLNYTARFMDSIYGGVVDPTFAPDGVGFRFLDKGVLWAVDPEAGTISRVEETYEIPMPEADRLLRERTKPRPVRRGFILFDPAPMEIPSPDGALLLGEKGPNLAIRSVIDDRRHQLTRDGVEGFAWQVDGPIWWAKGAVWAPDSERIAVVRKDTRGCDPIPVVGWLQTIEQVDFYPFPKTGRPLAICSAALIDVRSRRAVCIDLPGESDQLIAPVGWRRDGKEAYFLTTDRRRRYLRLYAVEVASGAPRLVCEETQETFVIGVRRLERFAPVQILADDRRLLWYSERDGWRHLYLYATDGREIVQLTRGPYEVLNVLDIDLSAETVFFTAHADPERPYDVHICRVGLDGEGFVKLTRDTGVHSAVLSPSKTYLIDTHSSIDRAPSTDLLRADGTHVLTLSVADTSKLAEMKLPAVEPFTALAADGSTELHGVIYLPPDLDTSSANPVIEYVYGGPQGAITPVSFTSGLGYFGMAMAIAAEGFVVVTLDGRGTPGRGKAFQDALYGRIHEFVDDHVHVMSQLFERHSFLDSTRVGIIGASWGGFSTVRAMLTAPDLYKVGVAICPVYDFDDHLAYAIEPYMGLPVDRPEAYRAASNIDIADRLQGKLLMIHGTSDVNADFSGTMKMCEALARTDTPYDLVVLPEADHAFTAGGLHQQRYMQAATMRYFIEHL